MKFNAICGIIGSTGLLAISASDVELWVSVICSAVIAIVTCILQVVKMFKDAKSNNTETEKDEKTESEGKDNEDVK